MMSLFSANSSEAMLPAGLTELTNYYAMKRDSMRGSMDVVNKGCVIVFVRSVVMVHLNCDPRVVNAVNYARWWLVLPAETVDHPSV